MALNPLKMKIRVEISILCSILSTISSALLHSDAKISQTKWAVFSSGEGFSHGYSSPLIQLLRQQVPIDWESTEYPRLRLFKMREDSSIELACLNLLTPFQQISLVELKELRELWFSGSLSSDTSILLCFWYTISLQDSFDRLEMAVLFLSVSSVRKVSTRISLTLRQSSESIILLLSRKRIYQEASYRKVPSSSLFQSYRMILACSSAMLLRFCSSSILPLLEGSSILLSCSLLEAISSKKYLSLFDSYFNLPKFSSRVFTSAGLSPFLRRQSLDPWVFLTVFLTDRDRFSFYFQGLEKEIDFFILPLAWGRLCSIEWTISRISLSRGFEMGPISDRLKAAMILRISTRLPSELFLLSSLEYSSKQLDITLKSQIFSLILSEKLT